MMTISKKYISIFQKFPLFFFLLIFCYIPAIFLVIASFLKKGDGDKILIEFTFGNYYRIFSEPIYLIAILKSILISILVALICLILAFPICYFIRFKLSNRVALIFLSLLIIPFWTNYLVRTFSWMSILGNNGLINYILLSFNIINKPILFMLYSWFSVIISMTAYYLPFMIIALYAGMLRIDKITLSASKDLGASDLYTIIKIIFPLIKHGIFAGFVLVFVPAIDEFVSPQFLGNSDNFLIANFISTFFKNSFEYSFGSALAITSVICSVAIVLMVKRIIIKN